MASFLEDVHTHLSADIAAAEAKIEEAKQAIEAKRGVLSQIEAELNRIPTLDDVRAVLDRVASYVPKLG